MGKARNLARLVVDSSGGLDGGNIPDGSVTTAKIAAGAVATVDIADAAVTTAKITDANITTAKIADSAITTGKIADGAVATADIADSAVTTAKIANANVTVAKLSATGTPSSTTFLRGDGSWQAVSSTPTTDQVLTATAGAAHLGVGTYAVLQNAAGANYSGGQSVAGSSLRYNASGDSFGGTGQSVNSYNGGGTAAPGTWRKMSTGNDYVNSANEYFSWYKGLYLRIS